MSSCNNKDYEILNQTIVEEMFPLTKYKTKTGITVYVCEAPGAIVYGNLVFGTVPLDNDGLPKIVQHLVSFGSELYPYKSILKKVASSCFDAFFLQSYDLVSVDYTKYSMGTVGSEGFLKLISVYLDYLLYPTLTEEAFLAEVYHVDGDGEDGGSLYSAQESQDNDCDWILTNEINQELYPEDCGFRYLSCGQAKNLRENVTIQKVRDYHRKFYRPDNLCIIIIGQIDVNDIFQTLSSFEDRIIKKGLLTDLTRPWQNPVPPLTQPVQKVAAFPTQYEESGAVSVGWHGPHINEIMECRALEILLQYLCDSTGSPLRRDFVESEEESYCSNILFAFTESGQTDISLDFESVKRNKLFDVKSRLLETLSNIATGKEQLNMETISDIIHDKKLNIFNKLDNEVYALLFRMVVYDFLYAQSTSDFQQRMQPVQVINKLDEKDSSFWQNLLKKYLLNENFVTVIGEPSPTLQKQLIEEERNRIKKRKEDLGKAGLKQKEIELRLAKEKIDMEAPKELLDSVCLSSFVKLNLYPVVRITNCVNDPNYDSRLKDMPCCFQVDDVKTNFVTIHVLMDTSVLPLKLRLYIPLYLQLMMTVPIVRNGELINSKQIKTQLDEDTIERDYFCGFEGYQWYYPGTFSQLVGLNIKIEREKYEKGIQWLHELLYKTKFSSDYIEAIVTVTLEMIESGKSDSLMILRSIQNSIYFSKESIHWSSDWFRQQNFLTKIKKILDDNPDEIINDLEMLRSKLTEPENVLVHMTCDLKSLGENALSCWKKFIEPSPQRQFIRHKMKRTEDLVLPIESSISRSSIYGVEESERFLMDQLARGVDSWHHADYPALLVAANYFMQEECPLRDEMKRLNIERSYLISLIEDAGQIRFYLGNCTDLPEIYKTVRKYVHDLMNSKKQWDHEVIQAAKKFIIMEIGMGRNVSITDLSLHSLEDYYKGINYDFPRSFINKVLQVTTDDLMQVGIKYLLPLFDPSKSLCCIVGSKSKMEDIITRFKELSRDLTAITDIEQSFLAHIDDQIFEK